MPEISLNMQIYMKQIAKSDKQNWGNSGLTILAEDSKEQKREIEDSPKSQGSSGEVSREFCEGLFVGLIYIYYKAKSV